MSIVSNNGSGLDQQLAGLDINQGQEAGGRAGGAYVPPHRRDAGGDSRSDSGRRSKNDSYRNDESRERDSSRG